MSKVKCTICKKHKAKQMSLSHWSVMAGKVLCSGCNNEIIKNRAYREYLIDAFESENNIDTVLAPIAFNQRIKELRW